MCKSKKPAEIAPQAFEIHLLFGFVACSSDGLAEEFNFAVTERYTQTLDVLEEILKNHYN